MNYLKKVLKVFFVGLFFLIIGIIFVSLFPMVALFVEDEIDIFDSFF